MWVAMSAIRTASPNPSTCQPPSAQCCQPSPGLRPTTIPDDIDVSGRRMDRGALLQLIRYHHAP
jgi:hypothetical protein